MPFAHLALSSRFDLAETLTADLLLNNRSYYQLSPRPPSTLFTEESQFDWFHAVHYDPASFPSWRGTSATFTAWVKAESHGMIISKSPDSTQSRTCWSFLLGRNGIATAGGATVRAFLCCKSF